MPPSSQCPRLLELFAGTGSVGAVFREFGWDVYSLDLDDSQVALDFCGDILEWDYRQFPPGHFQAIWASPPCTHYSVARTTAKTPRDLDGSDLLVARALEIVVYFQPPAFFLENPQSGLLKARQVIRNVPWVDVDYCRYGTLYRKRTRIWTNVSHHLSLAPLCHQDCENIADGKHAACAQRGFGGGRRFSVHELHRIPKGLVTDIVAAAVRAQT